MEVKEKGDCGIGTLLNKTEGQIRKITQFCPGQVGYANGQSIDK